MHNRSFNGLYFMFRELVDGTLWSWQSTLNAYWESRFGYSDFKWRKPGYHDKTIAISWLLWSLPLVIVARQWREGRYWCRKTLETGADDTVVVVAAAAAAGGEQSYCRKWLMDGHAMTSLPWPRDGWHIRVDECTNCTCDVKAVHPIV